MALKIKDLESIFNEGYSLADLLPYEECIDGIFILSDGSLGRVWELNSIESEGKSEQVINSISTQLESLLTRMPNDCLACQIIIRAGQDISEKLNTYLTFDEGECGNRTFVQGKSMLADKGNFIKDLRIFMTLRFFPDWVHPSFWDKALGMLQCNDKVEAQIKSQMMRHRVEFNHHIALFEGLFTSMGLNANVLCAQELSTWVYGILNPKRARQIREILIEASEPIRNQVLFNAPRAQGVGLELEEMQMRIISLKELPKETYPGMFTRESYEGNKFCFLDIAQDFMMVINLTVPSAQESLNRLNRHKTFAFMHQENFLGDKSVEAVEKKKELDETIAQMFQGGGKIVNARIHWVICAEDEASVEAGANQVLSNLSRLNCEGIKEEMIAASLFLTCLPLNFDPYYEQYIRRVRRLSSGNAADMLPLFGSVQGHKSPAQMYLNRRGEIVFVDFFESNTNPHGVVIGASGSGKSFFINDFILQNERLGAYFFVLDKGDSYKKLNQILQGQYIAFDLNHPVTINPFANELTPENSSFLLSMLSVMASGGDERDRLSREEEGLLHKAMLKAYAQKAKNGEVTLSDVVNVLKDNEFNDKFGINSLMGPTLGLRLTPFTKNGPYGGFFDGPNQFSIHGRFTVFELANLSAYPDLQVVVLLNLMFYMTNFVSSPILKPKRKYLLIDEAWSLLKVKNTAEFVTNAFKTFRKHRCSVVAITQELADLMKQESGIAIVANAANKIFLKQESSVIDLLKESLSLDECVIKALKSVVTVKRKYSEMYLMTDSSSGIIRLMSDPFLYWAASSEAKDNAYLLDQAGKNQGDLFKAIEICSKEKPYGI